MSRPGPGSGKKMLSVFRCSECNTRQCCREDSSGDARVCSSLLCVEDPKCKSDSFEVFNGGDDITCLGCQLKKATTPQVEIKQEW